MPTVCRRLLVLLIMLALAPFGHAQLRELGTGAPGLIKAQHLTAELISGSGAITPGGKSRVALL